MYTNETTTATLDEQMASRPAGGARLSLEEETSLARDWRERGDTDARARLAEANLGLVVAIAKRYRASGVSLEELIAEGNLGLLHAVDGFDPDCGARFSTYAAYWIRQGISRAFAASTPRGRLGGRDRRDVMALERAMRHHYTQTGEQPTLADLAKALEWPTDRVASCTAMSRAFVRPGSIDDSIRESNRRTSEPAAPQASPSAPDPTALAQEVDRLLKDLTPVERAALELRFGLHGAEPQGVDTIAESLDCSRRETRQAMRSAMAKLSKLCRGSRAAELAAIAGDAGFGPEGVEGSSSSTR